MRGIYPISERDLRQIFAEAVLASPANSGMSCEIITGIGSIDPSREAVCPWIREPSLKHLTTSQRHVKSGYDQESEDALEREHGTTKKRLRDLLASTSSNLEQADTQELASSIIREALIDQISSLQLEDVKNIRPDVSLLDLGIDSLVATEISTWIKKEAKVQVPHPFIFEGATVDGIVQYVVERLYQSEYEARPHWTSG